MFLLRVGVATVLLYAASASLIDPNSWIGFLPGWMRTMMPPKILLTAFSIYEILLALWLLSGKRTFEASLLAALTLFAITITNFRILEIVFRDIAIMFGALALAALTKKPRLAEAK